jgi:hypothetical protein
MLTNKANLLLAVLVLIFSLPLANPASAEDKTFIKEYTYQASEFDSITNASTREATTGQVCWPWKPLFLPAGSNFAISSPCAGSLSTPRNKQVPRI